MYQVIADGIPWEDADGNTEWPYEEAVALAEVVESQGYIVQNILKEN